MMTTMKKKRARQMGRTMIRESDPLTPVTQKQHESDLFMSMTQKQYESGLLKPVAQNSPM